jgi:hypothetical protein
MGTQTGKDSYVDAYQLDTVFEFLVKHLELGHLSPAWRAQPGPEVQHHGFAPAVETGQIAVSENYFFDSLEQAEVEVLGLFSLTAAAAAGGHRYHHHYYDSDGRQRSQTVFHGILLRRLANAGPP